MSDKLKIQKEVFEYELSQLRMMRVRAKDDPQRALVIAEREVAVREELDALLSADEAA